MAYLEKLGISTETVEHPEVFTVEAMMPHLQHIDGAVGKNLFLKDKKKKALWLVTVVADRTVNLAELSKKVGAAGGLRFASEDILQEKLGVGQGCVTPFALFNDSGNEVKFVLDADLVEGKHAKIYFHPMTNAASTGIKPDDFLKFVSSTGHEPVLVHL